MDNKEDFIKRNLEVDFLKERYPDKENRKEFLKNAWDDFQENEYGLINDSGKTEKVGVEIRNSKNSNVESGDRVVIGYATTEEITDDNMLITKEALRKAQDGLLENNTMLFNHDMDKAVGHIVETYVDEIGLLIKAVISEEEDELWGKIQDGTINKFSIQGRALDMEPIEGENGEEVYKVNEIELFEAGPVTIAGNTGAQTLKSYVAK